MIHFLKKLSYAAGSFLFPEQTALHRLKKKHIQKLKSYEPFLQMTEEDYPQALSEMYFQKMGMNPDLVHPITYTEKVQWRKLYDKNPLLSLCSDKYEVRKWVAERLGEQYLVPLLGCWDSPEDIDFRALPEQFALKVNNSSGSNIIVTDKKQLRVKIVKEKLRFMLKEPSWFRNGFEMHYRDIQPRILAEEYISELSDSLFDYKFYCFDGKPLYIQCIGNRNIEKGTAFDANFDLDWNRMDWTDEHFPSFPADAEIPKPPHFEELKECAAILSQGFDFVRVDLYDLAEKGVLFGEMTFTPGSGFRPYGSTWTLEKDIWLGALWDLPVR